MLGACRKYCTNSDDEVLVDDEIPKHGDSHASSSHEVSLEPTFKRREDFGQAQCLYSFP